MDSLLASTAVTLYFIILPLLVAAGFVAGVDWASRRLGEPAAVRRRRTLLAAGGSVAWLTITAAIAASGVLRRFDLFPPPFMVMALTIAVTGVALAVSRVGQLLARGVPLWALVGFQAFRFPLELAMHRAYEEGIMPEQMSFSGRNLDILTGISAAVVGLALLSARVPQRLVWWWNAGGFVLLLNIVGVAILSTPLFQFFGPDRLNVFVTYPPFVWLPMVMVTAALTGHLVIWRALRMAQR